MAVFLIIYYIFAPLDELLTWGPNKGPVTKNRKKDEKILHDNDGSRAPDG